MNKIFALLAVIAIAGCSLFSKDKYEQPKYEVLSKNGEIEIRQYKPFLLAEVEIEGKDRDEAANAGFKILADYIFGNNKPNSKIAMTAPVTQEKLGQPIAMTAPVTQEKAENGKWKIGFSMPSEYTKSSLPAPENERIKIIEVKPYKAVALTFSGFWSDSNFTENLKIIEKHILENKLKTEMNPVYAYYNPPFTLPWNRRNEIIFRIRD